MFQSWEEYRNYLCDKMLEPNIAAMFHKRFNKMDIDYAGIKRREIMLRVQITSILSNDFEFTKTTNWERTPEVHDWRRWKRGMHHPKNKTNAYIIG